MTENNQVVNLNFDVAHRDIRVGDEVVRLSLSDDVRNNFAFDIKEAFKDIEKIAKSDRKDQTREDVQKETDEIKSILSNVYDNSLGDGTFDKVYEAAGKSTPNCMQFLAVCLDIIHEFDENLKKSVQTRKANKYLKNKQAQQKSK